MRRAPHVLVAVALLLGVASCGSDTLSSDAAAPTSIAPGQEYKLVSDTAVATGFAAVLRNADEAATAAATDPGSAQAKVDELYTEWFKFEGTVRKVDQSAYLDMEGALTDIKLGVSKNDAARVAAGANAFRPLVESYLEEHPAGAAAAAKAAPSVPANAVAVPVLLTDYEISTPNVQPAGPTVFTITNNGKLDHEFVVLRTDIAPQALKVDADGGLEEKQPGVTLVDEHEDINPGATVTLYIPLEPGKYVLLCNTPEHFKHKMYLQLTVS